MAVLLGILALVSPLGEGLRRLSFDSLFLFRGASPPDEVVLVVMDDRSMLSLGQFDAPMWDRALHARLLDKLNAARVNAVVFDLFFAEPHTNPPVSDEPLARAIQSTPNVVLAAQWQTRDSSGGRLIAPIPPFRKRTVRGLENFGIDDLSLDSDGVVRRHLHRPDIKTSLSWRAAEAIADAPPQDSARARCINYYGPAGSLPRLSYTDVLVADLPTSRALEGKTVFVGADISFGPKLARYVDRFDIPYTRWDGQQAAQLEIQATCFLNLLRGDWLNEMSPGLELFITLICGVGFGLGLARLRWSLGAAVSGTAVVLIAVVASWLAWSHHVWFSWLVIAMVQVPAALACALVFRSRRSARSVAGLTGIEHPENN